MRWRIGCVIFCLWYPCLQGLLSKMKESSRRCLHKCRWETPSAPQKRCQVLRVAESSSPDEGLQQDEPTRPVGLVPGTSLSLMMSVSFCLANLSLAAGVPVAHAVAHPLMLSVSPSLEVVGPQGSAGASAGWDLYSSLVPRLPLGRRDQLPLLFSFLWVLGG